MSSVLYIFLKYFWSGGILSLNRRAGCDSIKVETGAKGGSGLSITFGTMLSQVAGLFVLLVLGYLLNRLRLLPAETEAVLSQSVTKLFLPALLLFTFMEECTPENLKSCGTLILYGGLFQAAGIALAVVLARLLTRDRPALEGVYRYALAFPNTGGFGNPVVLALFGVSGLFQYQLYLLVNTFLCYLWGVPQLMPAHDRGGLRERLKELLNPGLMGLLLGAVLGLTGLAAAFPGAVRTTVENLGGCYSVMALLLTGFVIGDYSVLELFREKRTYVMAALRLILIPGAFLLVLRALRLPETLCLWTCLVYACPCGMNTVVFPAAYGEDTHPGASLTLVTSTLAVFTIPLLVALAQ